MIIPINTENKKIPKKIEGKNFNAEVLRYIHAEEDLRNVLESEKLIKKTRGNAGKWPDPKKLSLEENAIDLAWHQREFENGISFAYLMRSKKDEYLGCAYLYPMNFRSKIPDAKKYEVDFSFWITSKFYSVELYDGVKNEWLEILKNMGFKRVYYSNIL
jgi:hypothetical protein